jgi:hypothetical protein
MIVFVGGMQRSGSTFSFNVVREILRRRGGVYQEVSPHVLGVVEQAAINVPQAKHVIVKAHSIDEPSLAALRLGGIHAICTVRRPEDAIASHIDVFGVNFEAAVDGIHEWLKRYGQIAPFALTINYELIERLPLWAAWRIARYVCPSVMPAEVVSIWRRHRKSAVKALTDNIKRDNPGVRDVGFSYYDLKTFYHRRHISSIKRRLAKATLSDAQITAIRKRLLEFLDSHGNIK